MRCPYCNCPESKVIDSRSQDDSIRRRRCCEKCGRRFNTYERVDTIPLTVVKRDGSREIFEASKILDGIMKSCNKRPISVKQMENIVYDIENTALNSLEKEVESKVIGEMVMERMKDLDEVAYVRFASVYRQFKDINTFIDELSKLINEKNSTVE